MLYKLHTHWRETRNGPRGRDNNEKNRCCFYNELERKINNEFQLRMVVKVIVHKKYIFLLQKNN